MNFSSLIRVGCFAAAAPFLVSCGLLLDTSPPDSNGGPSCGSDADCDDGNVCNGIEGCDTGSGQCQIFGTISCDDGLGCTVDTCDPDQNACVHTADDAACSVLQICDPSQDPAVRPNGCIVPTACDANPECDDDNPCNGVETCANHIC